MPAYALRTDDCFDKVKAWVEAQGFGGFSVRETVNNSNEHWHWLLETDRELHPVRCSFNRAIPELKGNGKYSLTVCRDIDKYVRYLCKGESEGVTPELAWSNSLVYDAAKLEELHVQYWDENRRLKKRKVGSMIDWCVDECKRLGVQYTDRKRISEIYIRELMSRCKPINLFSIRANVNTVQATLCPDDTILSALTDRLEQY